jgi:hypothetical protein
MAAAVPLRSDFDAAQLRALAKRSRDPDQTRRLLALAAIYEGASRTEFPFAWRTRLDETVMVVRPAGRLVLPWCERARY